MLILRVSLLLALITLTIQRSTKKQTDLSDWFQNIIDDQADAIAKAKRNIISGAKSWLIVEPTERETIYVDKAMCSMFSIGTDNLLDTVREFEEFCRERDDFLVEIAAWVIRKYTFHINIRAFVSILLYNMRQKNNLYCADDNFRKSYVNFTEHLTSINSKLSSIRFQFIDTLVAIQKSKIGVTKIPNFCCGYWRYRNHTIEAIDPTISDLRHFVKDMMDSFFSDSIHLVCLPFREKFTSICSYYPVGHGQGHIRQSILMNMINAISKITYIAF